MEKIIGIFFLFDGILSKMNAVILCGGFGKRLAPLTNQSPKPMLSVANRPMIDYVLSQLYFYGIKQITLTLAYMPQTIIDYTRAMKEFEFHYSVEQLPLGTAGGVKSAEKYLTDDVVLITSGDGLNNIDLSEMYESHVASGADITMAITKSDMPWLYGVVEHKNGFVRNFFEKPQDASGKMWINTGVYLLNRYVLNYIPADTFYDFSKDLFPFVLEKGAIGVYEHNGYWSDIGDHYSYYKANMDMIKGGLYPFVFEEGEKDRLFGGSELSLVSSSASVVGRISGCIVGSHSRVASGAVLNKCVVLDNTIAKGRHTGCILTGDTAIDVSEYLSPLNSKIFKKTSYKDV